MRFRVLIPAAFTCTSFFLGYSLRPTLNILGRSALRLSDSISIRASSPDRDGKHVVQDIEKRSIFKTNSLKNTHSLADRFGLKGVPQGCAEWFAGVETFELYNIINERSAEYDKKYVYPVLIRPEGDDPDSDGGVGESVATLGATTHWTATLTLELNDKMAQTFLMFNLAEENLTKVSMNDRALFVDIVVNADRSWSDGMGSGTRLKYLPKKDGDYVVSGPFWGTTVPLYYSHAIMTVPWASGGGKLYLLNAKTKKWLEPVSFTWLPASSEEFKAFLNKTWVGE